jgi:tRNA threonylcarbamoyladenosine biosynthesis protein TsaB
MKLLAIDTSAEACSAALLLGGAVHERFEVQPQRQSELILPMMDALLAAAGLRIGDLDALAFARGPGSFTGVRIATGVAQGAAYAVDLPVVAVSTLAALAQGHLRETGHPRVLVAADARMGEIYWAACEADGTGVMRVVGEERVCAAAGIALPPGGGWDAVGSAWAVCGDALAARLGDRLRHVGSAVHCRAQDVAAIAAAEVVAGRAVPAASALPVYLRDQVAWTKARPPHSPAPN